MVSLPLAGSRDTLKNTMSSAAGVPAIVMADDSAVV